MTAACMPACTMSASREKRQIGSGVVSEGGTFTDPYDAPSVPMSPAFFPAARRMLQIIVAVVVLPLVPVTPTIFRLRSG